MKKIYALIVSVAITMLLSISAMASFDNGINLDTGSYLVPIDNPVLGFVLATQPEPVLIAYEKQDFDVGHVVATDLKYETSLLLLEASELAAADYKTPILTYKVAWRS